MALAAMLAVAACDRCGSTTGADAGPVDAGPPLLHEREPNDSPQTALSVGGTAIVEASLGADPSAPDEDWFVLKASLAQTVDVRVSCPAGADVALELVDDSKATLAAVNAGGLGAEERLPNVHVEGQAYLRVVTVKKGAGGAYTVRFTFRPTVPGFEREPNERAVDATLVTLGQAVSGFVAHPADLDWYRFEVPSPSPSGVAPPIAPTDDDAGAMDAGIEEDGGLADAGAAAGPRLALRLDVSPVEGVAFDVSLLTEAQAVLFSAKSKEGAGLSLRNIGVRDIDRVLFVSIKTVDKRGANVDTYYTLTLAPEEATGTTEFEPNDSVDKATELNGGSWREGFLSPKGDVDYYRLVTDGPSLATLQLSGVDKVDVVLSVVRVFEGKPEEVVLRANEGGAKEPEVLNDVACDGACLLRIEAAPRKVDGAWVRDQENALRPYRLTTSVVPDDGSAEREPNGKAAQATPVVLGRAVRGTVYPKKDVDYFALDLRDRPVKTALSASLLGVLKVDVGLYLHRVDEAGALTLVQTSDGAKGEKPEVIRFSAEPGLYVFEVRDAKNREANFQDRYQLTVEEAGD